MNKNLMWAAASGIVAVLAAAGSMAQEEQDESAGIVPVELYSCNYREGQGPADLDAVVKKWNAWSDKTDAPAYLAMTLTPYYYGPEQDFDFAWLGLAPDGVTLGRGQDHWLANGGKIQAEFDRLADCNGHANFAVLNFKEPPEREDPSSLVISFSDCKIAEGKSFKDVSPALEAWAAYRTEHGSQSGQWVFFPAYGGGGAEFNYKFVAAYQNYESMGADYDQFGKEGYKKAGELFRGLVKCDDSRVYNATLRRNSFPDDE